jgi:hypothetical protein
MNRVIPLRRKIKSELDENLGSISRLINMNSLVSSPPSPSESSVRGTPESSGEIEVIFDFNRLIYDCW